MTDTSGRNPAMTRSRMRATVYLLYDQDHVVSVHASERGAQAERAAVVARAKAELAEPELEHLVDAQIAVVERRLLP